MTPYQFEGLLKRHLQQREHQEFLFGQLNATVANTGFARPENPAAPRDFMPSQRVKSTEPVERMTAQEFSQAIHALAARHAARLGPD